MTKHYKITSKHHSELGSVGDVVELTKEEYASTPYNVFLRSMEEVASTKVDDEEEVQEDAVIDGDNIENE